MAGGRQKGGKDNPTNQWKMPNQTMVQQIVINEKYSKAKKAANTQVKRRQALEIKDKAKKERLAMSFFVWRLKKPAAVRDELLNFDVPSLNADGQAIDETLAPVNIDDNPKRSKVNHKLANNQATKDPVMPTNFWSHLSIKTFDPKDINPNFDKSEDAKDIDDKD